MLEKRKLLGSTKVSSDNIVKIVQNAVNVLGIKKGDTLSFYEESGKVYIEKSR